MRTFVTVGEASQLLKEPEWRVRRAADLLGNLDRIPPNTRLIPRTRLDELARLIAALRKPKQRPEAQQ